MIARALAVALAAAMAVSALQTWRLSECQSDALRVQAEQAQAIARATERARAVETEWAINARKASQTYAEKSARARADAGAASAELERLRAVLAPAGGASDPAEAAASAARDDDLTRARTVVGQCAAALVRVAQAADDAEARLVALQSYVAGIKQE